MLRKIYLCNDRCIIICSAQRRHMERDRSISRERSEYVRTVEHIRSIQTRNTTVFLVSCVEQEGPGVTTIQSRRNYSVANELAIGCLY